MINNSNDAVSTAVVLGLNGEAYLGDVGHLGRR